MRPPVALALGSALVLGPATSGWLSYRLAVAELDQAMALRPPLAVIDYRPVTAHLAAGIPARDLEPVITTLKSQAGRLQTHGYLVLSGIAVEAAPTALLVQPDLSRLPPLPVTLPAPAPDPASPPAPATAPPAIAPGEARAVIEALTAPPGSRP